MLMKQNLIMLDYPALAAVAAVIREGSFDRAAIALSITASAVSQRVRGLEDRLGSILIVRGQPCVATELGRTLCAHFDQVRLLEADLAPTLALRSSDGELPLSLRVAVNADSFATWFPGAAAAFARSAGLLLDLVLEDEAHTADRLRSGDVVAAVTADRDPVQGCKTVELGVMRYIACASPSFIARHFAEGVNATALAHAPHVRFDRRDMLQARWAREAHGVELGALTNWVPTTHGMLDFALTGTAWAMLPVQLVQPHISAGRLVELAPKLSLEVKLYWTITRLHSASLLSLTDAVRDAARDMLKDQSDQ